MADEGRVAVRAASGSYTVRVGPGASRHLPDVADGLIPGGRIALITDSNVGPLHGDRIAHTCRCAGLDVVSLRFPAGESSKSRRQWMRLTDDLLDAGLGRDHGIAALGGGVTTDLAGFVAATYMRGIPVVQLPSSYLAMIDASVGGKTGVDVEAGKNLVGAFHAPAAVLADTELLQTLPARARREGLVEGVKHGAILDAEHLARLRGSLDELLAADVGVASEIVLASVALKARVVSEDEREAGFRQVLNFGHTIGHAIEAASGYGVGHGSAVGLGMLAEAEIGERMGVTDAGTREALEEVVGALLTPLPAPVSVSRALAFLGHDKKARRGRPRFVLLRRPGAVARDGERWTWEAPEAVVEAALGRVLEAD